MEHKKIKLKTVDHFSIAGVHTIAERKVVVLWLHGITVHKDEYLNLFKDGAEFLGKDGIDSLRIDFRGHGKSSGHSMDFSVIGQMIDVDSAIDYLKIFYKTEKINIYIVGCSFGAPPSVFSAIEFPEIVKGIILIAPVLSYQRTFLKPETDWAKSLFNKKTISKLYKTNKLYIDKHFPISMNLYKQMELIHPEKSISDIKQKVTIIHGNADSMVPYNASKDIADQTRNTNLVTIQDMDHGFNDMDDEIGTSEKSLRNKQNIYEIIKSFVADGKK